MKNLSVLVVLLFSFGLFYMGCQDVNQPEDFTSQKTTLEKKDPCTTIQDGTLLTSTGDVIKTAYDEYGYNYQAYMYTGLYGNYQRPPQPVTEGYKLMMKWNDAWLSNKDCDGDSKLDRHFGFPTYIGSGAWLTNHMSGEYLDDNGDKCHWTYFVKIVAAPLGANKVSGVWYAADGTEIGPAIWGDFAIIQQVENDPCAGIHGLQYVSPDHPGLGNW